MKVYSFLLIAIFSQNALCENDGFISYSGSYEIDQSSQVVIPKEPPVRSQDTVGLCYGFAAAAAYDVAFCKDNGIDSCATLPLEQSASSLEMSSFSSAGVESSDPNEKAILDVQSEGGSAVQALYNALKKSGITKESCAPFDQVVAKLGSPQEVQNLQIKSWENLKNTYQAAKKCSQCAIGNISASALDRIRADFRLKKTNIEMLRAFTAETYTKFLSEMLMPEECSQLKNKLILARGLWSLKQGEEKDFQDYDKSISKIKDVLKGGNPMIISGYCTMDVKPRTAEDCKKNQHSFLITGYRKICNSENTKECHEIVKVHNSWGQAWQDKNGKGGWVDAKEVLGRTYYKKGSFTWLEEN